MPFFVGITGGIGSGKSVVSSFLRDEGWFVVDFDELVRKALDMEYVVKEISKVLGDHVIKNGRLDKKAVSKIIFSDREKRKKIESIIHPIVEKMAFDMAYNSGKEIVAFDAPLLIETGFWRKMDKVILVKAPLELRIKRASRRLKISEDEVLKRISSQMDDKEREKFADYVIENDGSMEDLRKKVTNIAEKIMNEVKGYGKSK